MSLAPQTSIKTSKTFQVNLSLAYDLAKKGEKPLAATMALSGAYEPVVAINRAVSPMSLAAQESNLLGKTYSPTLDLSPSYSKTGVQRLVLGTTMGMTGSLLKRCRKALAQVLAMAGSLTPSASLHLVFSQVLGLLPNFTYVPTINLGQVFFKTFGTTMGLLGSLATSLDIVPRGPLVEDMINFWYTIIDKVNFLKRRPPSQ